MTESQRWASPTFVEIRMNAEIGSYQDEFEDRNPPPATEAAD